MAIQPKVSVSVMMHPDLVEQLDEQISDESRSAYIRAAVKDAIDGEE